MYSVGMDSSNEIVNQIHSELREIELFTREQSAYISPQLTKRILQLTSCELKCSSDLENILHRLKSVFSRLLIELIQAHYDTCEREKEIIRLMNKKGCAISNPGLLDQVIKLLIKLYNAAGLKGEASYERKVLVKFLLHELTRTFPTLDYEKREIEKLLQTLYKFRCFNVIQQNGASSRLNLKEELRNPLELRHHYDVNIVCFAQENSIRLSPNSWASLLGRSSTPKDVAHFQSILDKHQTKVTVDELRITVHETGSKVAIGNYLSDLLRLELDLYAIELRGDIEDLRSIFYALKNLARIKDLFIIRQCRGRMLVGEDQFNK